MDRALDRFLLSARVLPPVLHEAMRYSIFAGGKRLRPVLCLAAAEVCGRDSERVMPTACALELIHTYSLIHDDLPAMDDDDFRRGRPTSHKKFGEAVAILAGDALLTQAFDLMAQNARTAGVRPEAALKAVGAVSRAAGSLGMIGGQVMDLAMERAGRSKSLGAAHAFLKNGSRAAALDAIHRRKTGALIRASLQAGALLSGASPARVRALETYGEALGLAFQIADDVLDIIGDKKLLGKRGSDRENGKLTYPAVYGLAESQARARKEAARAKRALAPFGSRAWALEALADYVVQRQN